MAGTRGDTAVSWPGVSSAIALLTARRAGSGDRQADILGDQSLSEVIAALEIIAAGFLQVLSPGDGGVQVLEDLGLLALGEGARCGGAEPYGKRPRDAA